MNTAASNSQLTAELALGMDLALQSSERELREVRAILDTAAGIARSLSEAKVGVDGYVEPGLHDLSLELLNRIERRLEMLRIALGTVRYWAPANDEADAS